MKGSKSAVVGAVPSKSRRRKRKVHFWKDNIACDKYNRFINAFNRKTSKLISLFQANPNLHKTTRQRFLYPSWG